MEKEGPNIRRKIVHELEFVLLTLAAAARKTWAALDKTFVAVGPFLLYGYMAVNGFSSYQKHKNPILLTASVVVSVFSVCGFSYQITKAIKKRKGDKSSHETL